MDKHTAKSVKKVFGTNFQQYCKCHKIILKQNKSGSYMVPNANALTECIDVLNNIKIKVHKKLRKIETLKPSLKSKYNGNHYKKGNRAHKKRLREQCKISKKEEHVSCEKSINISPNIYFINLPLQIYLYDTSSVVPTFTVHTAPKDYILNTAKTGNEIYEFIIHRILKTVKISNYEFSIPFIAPLLKQFQEKHKKFHYSRVLKQLSQEQKFNAKLKYEYETPMKQLKLFFHLIFVKVVPLGLFGKLTNLKKVKKAMYRLLITPRFKSLDLVPLILRLDISSIAWLKNLQILKMQWFTLAKFIKWFFTGFLLKILRIQFHVTTVSANNNQRLYVARSNWCLVQKKFVKKKILSNALQPEIKCNQWTPPIGTFLLHPKISSLRSIFLSKYEEKDKDDISIVFKFLKQLQITEYGVTSFQEKWNSVIRLKRNSKSKQFYVISSDVKDAFGSIVQGHLYNIILLLSKKLPEDLLFSTYAVKSAGKHVDNNTLCYKQYFSNGNLQLPLSPGTLYACSSHSNSLRVKKNWLLQRIRKCIFHQKVKIGKRTYIIGKGIVQGTMLSPILSEIYYNFVFQKQMSLFGNCGVIIRYVDDILYVTDNEVFAKHFLEFVKKGIPQYNCYFKELKTQSNIANSTSKITNCITYIGYNINCDTLEVGPKHTSTSFQYLIKFSIKNNLTILKFFEKQIYNLSCLKLSQVVLDYEINTRSTIIKILQQTCLIQAKRTQVLIRALFDDIQKNAGKIFSIIKNNNIKITKYILKILLTLEEEISKRKLHRWYKKILKMLWITFKNVFKKDKILQQCFQKIYIQ